VLKSLEAKGLLLRRRSRTDERSVEVKLTPAGEQLRESAAPIPAQMAGCVGLSPEEALQLYRLLYKLLPTPD